jgi:polar amino acid transport system substrate-binding protein
MRAGTVLIAAALVLGAGLARAQDSCGSYTVRPNDSLHDIAVALYGNREAAFRIYDANRAVIGDNPDIVEKDIVLSLPCDGLLNPQGAVADAAVADDADGARVPPEPALAAGGAAPESIAAATVADARPEPAQTAPAQARIAVLTAGPFDPFVDQSRPGGGIMPELVSAAIDAAGGGAGHDIWFVNDRAAHLSALFPRGAFDLGVPWVWPDCGASGLTPDEAELCANFIASDPFYEHVIEIYARADGRFAEARFPADLEGAVMCRPAGYPLDDLAARGLIPDLVSLVRPAAVADCLAMLDRGEVDLASMDGSQTRMLAQSIQLASPLLVLDGLTLVETLHVIAPKADPRSGERIAMINQGLAGIADSGQWFDIVQRGLLLAGQGGWPPMAGAPDPGNGSGAGEGAGMTVPMSGAEGDAPHDADAAMHGDDSVLHGEDGAMAAAGAEHSGAGQAVTDHAAPEQAAPEQAGPGHAGQDRGAAPHGGDGGGDAVARTGAAGSETGPETGYDPADILRYGRGMELDRAGPGAGSPGTDAGSADGASLDTDTGAQAPGTILSPPQRTGDSPDVTLAAAATKGAGSGADPAAGPAVDPAGLGEAAVAEGRAVADPGAAQVAGEAIAAGTDAGVLAAIAPGSVINLAGVARRGALDGRGDATGRSLATSGTDTGLAPVTGSSVAPSLDPLAGPGADPSGQTYSRAPTATDDAAGIPGGGAVQPAGNAETGLRRGPAGLAAANAVPDSGIDTPIAVAVGAY